MREIFGWYAGFVYSLYLLPQIIKTYTTKSVEDLSAASLWLTFSGGLGMFIYLSGEKNLYPVKFNNRLCLLSIIILLVLYYKYKK
jgi:MtN3 and saliva related transmembrane protein